MSTETYYRYVIGDVAFSTRDEAEAWVEAGNIGGTYSITDEVWCNEHDWQPEWWNPRTRRYACWECSTAARVMQKELDAWNRGEPLYNR